MALIIGIHNDFCRRRVVVAAAVVEPFTPEESMRLLREFGWVGELRVRNGHVEARNNREATHDRWDRLS